MRCARPRAWSRVPRAPLRNWAYLDRRSTQRSGNLESTGIVSRPRSLPFGLPALPQIEAAPGFLSPFRPRQLFRGPNRRDFHAPTSDTHAEFSANAEIAA